METFIPTHVLRYVVGKKKHRHRVCVEQLGIQNGIMMYTCFVSPNSKLYRKGVHIVWMVPETNLQVLRRRNDSGFARSDCN